MLLFVAAVFVVFHFALPGEPSRLETTGFLWVAILFTALLALGRAFVPEREQRTMDGLVLAPCDRSAIWLAKSLATLAFLAAAEIVALPLYALFFHHVERRDGARGRARRHRDLRRRDVRRRDGGRDPRPRSPHAASLSAARDPDRRRALSARASPTHPAGISPSSRSTTRCSRSSAGRRSSLSCRSERACCDNRLGALSSPHSARRARGRVARARHDGARLRLLRRAERREPGLLAADLLLPRLDRDDGVRVLHRRRLEGAAASVEARSARRPRELRLRPPGHHLRRDGAPHRLDLGEDLVGPLVGVERGRARPVPHPLPLLLRVLHAPLLARPGAAARESERGVRALRRRPDPGELRGDPACEGVPPPACLCAERTASSAAGSSRRTSSRRWRCSSSRTRSTVSRSRGSGSTCGCGS